MEKEKVFKVRFNGWDLSGELIYSDSEGNAQLEAESLLEVIEIK